MEDERLKVYSLGRMRYVPTGNCAFVRKKMDAVNHVHTNANCKRYSYLPLSAINIFISFSLIPTIASPMSSLSSANTLGFL